MSIIMRSLYITLVLLMPASAFAAQYATDHEHSYMEFDPKVSCLYAGALYGPGSTIKQATGLYICKKADNQSFFQWTRITSKD